MSCLSTASGKTKQETECRLRGYQGSEAGRVHVATLPLAALLPKPDDGGTWKGRGKGFGVAAAVPREWNGRQLAWVSRPRVHQMMLGEPV